jgi:hypothetical protein
MYPELVILIILRWPTVGGQMAPSASSIILVSKRAKILKHDKHRFPSPLAPLKDGVVTSQQNPSSEIT